jgi:hypothetical protein
MPHFEFLGELRGHGLLFQAEVKRLNRKGREERAAKYAKKFKVRHDPALLSRLGGNAFWRGLG